MALKPDEIIDLTHDPDFRISAKMVRAIYEQSPHLEVKIEILSCLLSAEQVPWLKSFLWAELERQKSTEMGDWIIIRMAHLLNSLNDAERMASLYRDPSACSAARGSAVFGIHYVLTHMVWPESKVSSADQEAVRKLAKEVCEEAVNDQNAYARAGAGWVIGHIGGFEEDIKRLAEDETPTEGTTVGSYYRELVEPR